MDIFTSKSFRPPISSLNIKSNSVSSFSFRGASSIYKRNTVLLSNLTFFNQFRPSSVGTLPFTTSNGKQFFVSSCDTSTSVVLYGFNSPVYVLSFTELSFKSAHFLEFIETHYWVWGTCVYLHECLFIYLSIFPLVQVMSGEQQRCVNPGFPYLPPFLMRNFHLY